MDFETIEKLIKLMNDSKLGKLKIETEGMKISLTNGERNFPGVAASPVPVEVIVEDEGDYVYITSPLVGIYKSLSAAQKSSVKAGDRVEKGQPVCVIEAMKLINEIESEFEGEVVEILVSEGDAVEFEQKLFKIRSN
ncbi:MAG: acetyl-CoA carboxylase, biotin carboxyl carrier protein [Clostridiales bacterium]|jgi:acetyl-CoA carboxylase biotin carboxyl carrier protein|nr:acetyl-CoA carboxylase, biotin carboxyl carrier protein [Clostridiales bacterium]